MLDDHHSGRHHRSGDRVPGPRPAGLRRRRHRRTLDLSANGATPGPGGGGGRPGGRWSGGQSAKVLGRVSGAALDPADGVRGASGPAYTGSEYATQAGWQTELCAERTRSGGGGAGSGGGFSAVPVVAVGAAAPRRSMPRRGGAGRRPAVVSATAISIAASGVIRTRGGSPPIPPTPRRTRRRSGGSAEASLSTLRRSPTPSVSTLGGDDFTALGTMPPAGAFSPCDGSRGHPARIQLADRDRTWRAADRAHAPDADDALADPTVTSHDARPGRQLEPGGIDCGADCAEYYDVGAPVALTPPPPRIGVRR